MNTKYLLPAIGLATLPFLQSSKPTADSIRFAPSTEMAVAMEFSNSVEFFLEDFSAEMMGQDMTEMVGDVEASMNVDIDVEFTDTYREVDGGMPVAFTRTYGEASINGELTGAAQGESDTQSFELMDGMDGHTIIFEWDAEEDDYVRSYPEDVEGDEEILENLSARVDLAFLLPEGEVSEGDEWEIDPAPLVEVLIPGGDLNYDTPEGDRESAAGGEQEMDEETLELLRQMMSGDATGTYNGMNDDGMAVIGVTLDLAGDTNLADMIADAMSNIPDADPAEMPSFDDFTVDLALEGEGTLIWDPRSGHVVSFSMSAETEVSLSVAMGMEPQPGMFMEMTGQVSMGGTAEIEVEASH